ncbi:MAG: DNRLRE domain-containing protein, partial [Anaerolineae bacterium]|nr:DNRLRE domain-containing protein [Anaerolineae bacterium]
GMNVFTATQQTNVTHVEVWTNDVTTDVDMTLYQSFNGSTPQNMLWQSNDHVWGEAGYHSVPLGAPLQVPAGGNVVAVVKFTNAVYTFPVPIDMDGPANGSSYMSSNGTTWSRKANADIGIRLRTTTAPVNVGINKQVWGGNLGSHDPVTFTLQIKNTGIAPAAGVVVTDIIPSQVVSVTIDSTIAITATGAQDYVWDVAPIGVSQTEVISIYGQIAHWVLPGASFGNETWIWDPRDNTPGNNYSRVLVNERNIYLPLVARQYPPIQYTFLYPTGDAGILENFPNANTGSDTEMKVGYDIDGCFYMQSGAHVSRGLVQFDLSSLQSTSVTRATLYIHNASACSWQDVPNAPVQAFRVTSPWNENSVTWSTGPGFAEGYGSVLIPLGASFSADWREIDVTGLVNAWLQGAPNYGVMLRGHESYDEESAVMKILQHGTGYGPWLGIEYFGTAP